MASSACIRATRASGIARRMSTRRGISSLAIRTLKRETSSTPSSCTWIPGMITTGMHPCTTGSSMCAHPLPGTTAQKTERCSTRMKLRVCPPTSTQWCAAWRSSSSKSHAALCCWHRRGMHESRLSLCAAHTCGEKGKRWRSE